MNDWPATVKLATRAELAGMLNTRRAGDDAEGALLDLFLEAASHAAEAHRRRLFRPWPAPPEDPQGAQPDPVTWKIALAGRRMVRIPDARELTAVRMDGVLMGSELDALTLGASTAWPTYTGCGGALDTAGGYRLLARDGQPAHAILVPDGGRLLELEGHFGFSPTPPDVHLAVLEWAARAYHERTARMADGVSDPEGGTWAYFRQIPAGIAATLNRYWIPGL